MKGKEGKEKKRLHFPRLDTWTTQGNERNGIGRGFQHWKDLEGKHTHFSSPSLSFLPKKFRVNLLCDGCTCATSPSPTQYFLINQLQTLKCSFQDLKC